jgi:hypothetical protein
VRIVKIISGGQTGADQAALFAARRFEVRAGGWAAKGWMTEDGAAPWLADHGLVECEADGYPVRTRRNVEMADALIWFGNPHSAGGRLTLSCCITQAIDHFVVIEASKPLDVAQWLRGGIVATGDITLMVAGNRESSRPGIGKFAEEFLWTVLSHLEWDELPRKGRKP